jgi:hypothetical protein
MSGTIGVHTYHHRSYRTTQTRNPWYQPLRVLRQRARGGPGGFSWMREFELSHPAHLESPKSKF